MLIRAFDMLRTVMDPKASTLRQTGAGDTNEDANTRVSQPGLVAVFSGCKPQWQIIEIPCAIPSEGSVAVGELELGRDNVGRLLADGRISRRHALVQYSEAGFHVSDLGSLNGTTVDGQPAAGKGPLPLLRCLRIGDSLLLPVVDTHLFSAGSPFVCAGIVVGPTLSRLYQRITRIAKASSTLYITGESGAGKEHAARAFHEAGASTSRSSPFVAVNCATIPEGIAERLLFGARRGAFSGVVADSDGYVQAAHGGTLFLDEVADLHPSVQAKLLRVLETREVLAVGATRPQTVNVRICSASHRPLIEEVAAGRLREDLYYRMGRPAERVPPLRERLEEIPWLIGIEIQRSGVTMAPHCSFVEACMLRPWPGNIREFLVEVRSAVQEAAAYESTRLKAEHLAATAGQEIKGTASRAEDALAVPQVQAAATMATPISETSSAAAPAAQPGSTRPSRATILATLLDVKCNVSEASRRLGMHRTELRRQLKILDIDLSQLKQLGQQGRR